MCSRLFVRLVLACIVERQPAAVERRWLSLANVSPRRQQAVRHEDVVARDLSWPGKTKLLVGALALLYIPAALTLVFWPVPGKYPFGLPVVVGLAALVAIWRYRFFQDDVGAALAAVVGAGILAG